MLAELRADNLEFTRSMRATHEVCDKHNDVATASLIEVWIDETERRTWFLSEIVPQRSSLCEALAPAVLRGPSAESLREDRNTVSM
jgi:Ferritin-like domain